VISPVDGWIQSDSLDWNRLSLKSINREVVMGREEIIILDEGIDDPIDTDGVGCCSMIFLPFRS
jgi:hypothetical protein